MSVGDDGKVTQDRSLSQTLSRGLQVLEVLAAAGQPLTAQEIAAELGLSRTVVYRLLRTLEHHNLLGTDTPSGRFSIGLGLVTLSRSIHKPLREAAAPVITSLADQIGATAFFAIRDKDEFVCIVSAEAQNAPISVRTREGYRRKMAHSASGIAIFSTRPPRPDEDEAVIRARELGYAYRKRDVERHASAISAPVRSGPDEATACVTALFPSPSVSEVQSKASLIIDAAQQIAASMRL